ncbi:MAG: hypothetical protein AAFU60_17595 [Bacteroidota bacterium]
MGFATASGFNEINTGDISVSTDPVTNGVLAISGESTRDNFNVAADALKVYIRNDSIVDGGAAATATINGSIPLPPGDYKLFEAKKDPVTGVFKKLPALAVVTNGATITYYEER